MLKCFLQLIHRENFLFFKDFLRRLIDISIILVTNVLVFGYLMSNMGLKGSYGSFILIGAIASFGLFETIWNGTILAQDASDKKITNFLTLPIKSSHYFCSVAIAWAINTSILSLCLLPLGKLILWKELDLSHVSLGKFSLIFLSANLFYGFFALWMASLVTNLRNTGWLWCRVVNPLFMFCGYYYSWKAVFELSPLVGYLHFFNPLLFILEGTKAAVLGQSGYLSFWVCVGAIFAFTLIFSYDAVRRFKKRLDCV